MRGGIFSTDLPLTTLAAEPRIFLRTDFGDIVTWAMLLSLCSPETPGKIIESGFEGLAECGLPPRTSPHTGHLSLESIQQVLSLFRDGLLADNCIQINVRGRTNHWLIF
jgi:hypothetical protein